MSREHLNFFRQLVARFKISLKIGVSAAFALVMIPLTIGMVSYLYRNNMQLALAMADQAMVKASQDIVQDVGNLLNPVARVVEASAVLVRIDRGALRRVDGMRYFYDQMEKLPHVYSFFIGYGTDGSFYQVIRLPKSVEKFGPSGRPLPDGTQSALRILDSSSGSMADSFIFLADWGDVRGVDRGPAQYDPRVRPWYRAAWADKTVQISDVYTFASTGMPGLTVSKRAATDSGVEIGAVGADITLEALSGFLERKQIGKEGRVFILDGEGRLIAHPNLQMAVRTSGGKVELMKASEAVDPIVAEAVRRKDAGAGSHFTAPLGPENQAYMVSFTAFPKDFGKDWVIGIAVKESEFVGPLRESSIRILIAGTVVILLSIVAINWLSRVLTRPLLAIIGEASRIQRLDLGGDAAIRSKIIEIIDLAGAIASMKRSLRSFSVYIPKDLVRLIVAAGEDIRVGGERRKLAILFSDIKGFTRIVESMPPEQVMESLSSYFREISAIIHRHKGIIDKFIGDAVMALWNAPLDDDDPMAKACLAMLACNAACRRMEREFQQRELVPYVTRFGLHAGEAVVGNVGSEDRMQYTALGAEVNLASRLESLNKLYGTRMLASEALASQLRGRFLFRRIDYVVPVGTSRKIAIFEVIGECRAESEFAATDADTERCRHWDEAFDHYAARRWAEALIGFEAFARAYPDDGPVKVFLARCKDYAENAPPADWDTAQRLDQK